MSLHREAELTEELLEVVDVQPGARPVRVELRSQEGLVVDQQGAAPWVGGHFIAVIVVCFLGGFYLPILLISNTFLSFSLLSFIERSFVSTITLSVSLRGSILLSRVTLCFVHVSTSFGNEII